MSTKKLKFFPLAGSIALLSILVGCGANSKTDAVENDSKVAQAVNSPQQMDVVKSTEQKNKVGQHMTLTGQILYQQMEGGFYGFVASNGDKYLPSGLTSEFRKNGLIVELKAELMPDVLTTQQYGDVIKVLEIKVLDSSKVSDTHKTM